MLDNSLQITNILIINDSLSVLIALKSSCPNNKNLQKIDAELINIHKNNEFMCILSHIGIKGKNMADGALDSTKQS